MSDEHAPGKALEVRPATAMAAVMSDDEMRRMQRIAEAIHLSGAFKDVKKAEIAFVKMMLGRDLGLSPTQAMLGLHLVEGNVQVHYAMLGRFIKARADEGYDYEAGWIKAEPTPVDDDGVKVADTETIREAVLMKDDDPADQREVVGAFVRFTVQGNLIGTSTFTYEDAVAANLIKDGLDRRAAWNTARRNMYLARAMSNGVKWYVPEVLGGLPIYVDGEIVPEAESVTAPVGDGDDEGSGIDLGPKVEAIIERATVLGHRGLSNRATIELLLGKRAPGVVSQWVKDAKVALDEFEAKKKLEAEEGEVTDADVVEEATPVGDAVGIDEPIEHTDTSAAHAREVMDETAENQTMPQGIVTTEAQAAAEPENVKLLRHRIATLGAARADEQNPEQRALIDEELDTLEDALRELGVDPSKEG